MSSLPNALSAATEARALLDRAGGCKDGAEYHAWRERTRIAEDAATSILEAAGAKIKDDSGSTMSIVLAGIRSTSTMGLRGCLNNWLSAARAREAEA